MKALCRSLAAPSTHCEGFVQVPELVAIRVQPAGRGGGCSRHLIMSLEHHLHLGQPQRELSEVTVKAVQGVEGVLQALVAGSQSVEDINSVCAITRDSMASGSH